MESWQNFIVMKLRGDKRASRWNIKLTNWKVDKIPYLWNGEEMKEQVDEMESWQNYISM
jgi:hypothetical protein